MLEPARGAVFLQRTWRKLTYTLLIAIIVPVSAISIIVLLLSRAAKISCLAARSRRSAAFVGEDGVSTGQILPSADCSRTRLTRVRPLLLTAEVGNI
jgi:hypothetical protein